MELFYTHLNRSQKSQARNQVFAVKTMNCHIGSCDAYKSDLKCEKVKNGV